MWHLKLGYVIAFQFVLMYSVYVIYFQPSVVPRLEPQKALVNDTPADRLVIFIMDGLSVKSFFANYCSNVPDLKSIFLHQGQVGISRAVAASDCKSPLIALFSGFYEWKWNNGKFETLFDLGVISYGWGSAKLMNYLTIDKVIVPNNVTARNSHKLDQWVFNDVQRFLTTKAPQLLNVTSLVLVVQLLGLLKANGMEMYGKNIKYTQRGLWKLYNRLEQTFPDKRTAYLLTSSHGMTDKGLFGGDSKEEIETPFFLWGAGVSNTKSVRGRSIVIDKDINPVPLHIVEQIQLTPLMSILLGLPPPGNNRGRLPMDLLNATIRHETHAEFNNALQLQQLAISRLQHHQSSLFAKYMPSHWMDLRQLKTFASSGKLLWHQHRFVTLKEYSSNIMPILLQVIEYYENYYRRALLVVTTCGFLGWQHYLRCQRSSSVQIKCNSNRLRLIAKSLAHMTILLMILFLLLQRVPYIISGYLLMPVLIWKLALDAQQRSSKLSPCGPILLSLCCLLGFFHRGLASFFYLGFACYHNRTVFRRRSLHGSVWIAMVCGLTLIAWLTPSLGCNHRRQLIASLMLTFVQASVVRGIRGPQKWNLICNALALLLATILIVFVPSSWNSHLLARLYLCYVFIPPNRQQSFELLMYNLSTLYALLSTSYEALVIQLLAQELRLAFRIKNETGEVSNHNQIMAMYMLIYSLYSLFVIGDVEAVDNFRKLIQFNGFGFYSSFVIVVVITLKLCVPLLILICIICANCEIAWTHRLDIFYNLLAMCNGMAIVFLFRVHDYDSSCELGVRIAHFIAVQILPATLLLLINF
ncbi:hypothetical protein KR044_008495, partial [Drosophila immigrans]